MSGNPIMSLMGFRSMPADYQATHTLTIKDGEEFGEVRKNSEIHPIIEGRKDDQEKLPIHLLPIDSILGICAVLQYGANKYDDRNWEHGMDWHRPFSACLRHLFAWWQGEELDPESGLPHLDHALCSLIFLATYSRRKIGTDDRPKV